MFVGVLMDTWQFSLDWEHQINSLAKRFAWAGLAVRGNYAAELGEQIGEEEGGFKVIKWG